MLETVQLQLIVTTLANVLVLSSIYVLVALGFAFLFSIMGILNFAHGVFYMIAAYLCYKLTLMGMNQWFAMLSSMVIVGLFGVPLERFFFRPFYGNLNRTVVVCIGIITVLQNAVAITEGYSVSKLHAFVGGSVDFGMFSLTMERIATFSIAIGLLILTLLFISKTRLGQQMQAAAQNKEGALLQGISIHRISALACIIACSLAAVAGSLMGALLSLTPYMGDNIMAKVLEVLVLGGIGTIRGVLFAGFVIGALDASLPVFVGSAASDAISVLVVIIILLFRPQGLFGQEVRG
jgi:branched-chain amino acid transport system permease protein